MQVARGDWANVFRRFEAKTRRSAKLFRSATAINPGGVTAGIKFFDPYCSFMEHARRSVTGDRPADGVDAEPLTSAKRY